MTAGLYPNDRTPEGAGIQLFRSGWFNKEGKGLILRPGSTKPIVKRGEVPFVFHIEVGKARAGFGQKDFRDRFLASCGALLEQAGYIINPRYAMEPVKCYRPATPDTFATVAAKEFRFLSAFGTEVDRIIEELRQ